MTEIAETSRAMSKPQESQRKYLRFSLSERVEHWTFMASFTTLAITGLIQKYAQNPLSQGIIGILGGVENARLIHHVAATVMMIVAVYHLAAAGYRVYVRRRRFAILPDLQDIRNAIHALRYYFGRVKHPPQQGRYTFEEKVEYWAVVWGTLIMAVTGFMMWNPIATTHWLPGEFIPAAKAAHGAEAVLAVLAILLWHMYYVVVKFFNRSMFTGYLTEEEMLAEHPLELADLKAGIAPPPVTPGEVARRKKVYFPVSGVVSALLLVGIVYFVAFEKTAIETIPPAEDVEVFFPFTPTPLPTPPPSPTPPPASALTWEAGIAPLLAGKCVACHNSTSKLGGLDLTSYQAAQLGAAGGPIWQPGEPDASQIVIIQSQGGHPGQLSADELKLIRSWIENGAAEK